MNFEIGSVQREHIEGLSEMTGNANQHPKSSSKEFFFCCCCWFLFYFYLFYSAIPISFRRAGGPSPPHQPPSTARSSASASQNHHHIQRHRHHHRRRPGLQNPCVRQLPAGHHHGHQEGVESHLRHRGRAPRTTPYADPGCERSLRDLAARDRGPDPDLILRGRGRGRGRRPVGYCLLRSPCRTRPRPCPPGQRAGGRRLG